MSIVHLIHDILNGWFLHYIHSHGTSLLMLVLYYHIGRGLYIGIYINCISIWLSGIYILFMLMCICFLGYILVWGMMSYWGGTVISNLLSVIPCVFEIFIGNVFICGVSLKRFFIFHILISFCNVILILIHFHSIHGSCSSCPLGYNVSNISINFLRGLLIKDCYGYCIILV